MALCESNEKRGVAAVIQPGAPVLHVHLLYHLRPDALPHDAAYVGHMQPALPERAGRYRREVLLPAARRSACEYGILQSTPRGCPAM